MFQNLFLKQIVLLLFNAIFSIIVPFVSYHFKWTTGLESVTLGGLMSLLLFAAESQYNITAINARITAIDARKDDELKLWQIKNTFDTKLANLRESYSKMLSNRRDNPDLFQAFFDERIAELENMMLETGNRDELHLDKSHVVSVDVLLGSFKGETKDIFRAVHFIEDNDFFFDIYAKHYFYNTYKLVQEGKIKEVRRIIVYDEPDQLKDSRTEKLIAFHSCTNGYSFRVMLRKDYYSMLKDCRLSVPRDFGIYGDKYVYVAQVNLESNMVGYWARNPSTISLFLRFFDTCWTSPITIPPKECPQGASGTTLEELYS